MIKRINCQRLAGFRTGNQIVEVTPGVACPNLFYDQSVLLIGFKTESSDQFNSPTTEQNVAAAMTRSPFHVQRSVPLVSSNCILGQMVENRIHPIKTQPGQTMV